MSRLAVYTNPAGRTVVHHDGFSWLAFVGLPLWALQRRQFLVAAVLWPLLFLLHSAVQWSLERLVADDAAALLLLVWLVAWSVGAGRGANALHRRVLLRRHYVMTATEPPVARPTA